MTLCADGGLRIFFFLDSSTENEPPEDTKQVADERGRFDQIPTKILIFFCSFLLLTESIKIY
jgi:hypothetical protein